MLEIYHDPLFWAFPIGASLVSMGAFVVFAAPFTLLALVDPAWARPYRIQPVRKTNRPVIGPAIRQWLLNNGLQLVLVVLAWPLIRLSAIHLGPRPALWVMGLQILFFLYLDDFLYYWMHRAMHRGWLYKHIHGLHHRVPRPIAVTGHYMHPIEYVLTTGVMLLGPLLLGVHVFTLYAWVVVRQWEAAEGHSGYAFPWSPTHWLPGADGARHHDAHHAKFHGNYGGFLPIWDRVFGTYARDYRPGQKGAPP